MNRKELRVMNKVIKKITSGVLLCSMLAYTTPVLAFTKEETVYSKIDVNGKSYQTIVNNHLINEEKESILKDISSLLNIENVNGNEEFTQEGNSLTWKAEGKDIYYQGTTQKELPIECKVTYELDGKEIEAKELAGKSGTVKITIEYNNKDAHTVNINGKKETMYTPFVAICGTMIDNENNRNIQITNGKIVDNGNKTMVIGMAFPGMEESLKLSKDTIEIPNTIEITMETTNFELSNLITYVTPKILEEDDLELFDKLDEMYSKLNTLQSSSKQLVEGANTLKEGTKTYTEKSQEFNQAMKQITKGANSANQNYGQINSGINKLNQSSQLLQEGSKTINEGTKAISSNLNTVSQKLGELKAGSQTLLAGQKQVSAGFQQMITSIGNIQVTDNSSKITQLQNLVTANKTAKTNLETVNSNLNNSLVGADAQTEQTIKAQIQANENLIKLLENNIQANEQTISTLKQTDITSIKELQAGLSKLEQGIQELENGTQSLYDGQTAMKQGVDTLATKTEELAKGTDTIYQGTKELTQGTKALDTGSKQMKQGLTSLDVGAEKLLDANNQLLDGSKTISEGANTLSEGMTKFDKEGIQKIYNAVNGDLKDVKVRLETLQDLANEYNNFSMLEKENKGNVKFIIMMDSIKKEEANKEPIIVDNKEE